MSEKTKISGYAFGRKERRWIRAVTVRASNLNTYLKDLPDEVLILSVVPVTIAGQAYRRLTIDIERYENLDSNVRFHDGFDFRKMLRGTPIHPRK